MPPSKQACEIIAVTYKATSDIISKIAQVKSAVFKAIKLRNILKYGINIADALGGELVAAIGVVASQAATTLLGSASKIASTLMEGILNKLLQILLAFPTAVFSLVAIPHEAAKNATSKERRYLGLAQHNLETILRLITKWTGGFSGQKYYEQIRDALPLIERAIALAASMIRELEDPDNAFFDERKYNLMRANLTRAIQITKPYSILDETLQASSRIEQDKNRIYREKSKTINAKFQQDKQEAAIRFRNNLSANGSGNSSTNRLLNATNDHYVSIIYQNDIKDITNRRDNSLALAESEAEIEAIKQASIITKNVKNILGEFVKDVQVIQEQLFKLLDNTKNAYLKYKESQTLCANIYDIRNIIRNIISSLISIIRAGSNVAGDALSIPIKTSKGMMEAVQGNFQKASNKYNAADSGISATELSLAVVLGNGGLSVAEQLLNASVTQSLIDLINSDDVLQAADDKFEKFLQDISDIPDWDGERGVWAVDVLNSATSPYIQMIADCAEALAKIPVLSVSAKEADKKRIQSLMRQVSDSFRALFRHNIYVENTLNSYVPYMASEAGDIKAILASAGLLRNFALIMSITTLSSDILATTKGELGDEFPNYTRCKEAYPDLFSNLDLAAAAAASEGDMPAEQESLAFQESAEDKESDRLATKKLLSSANFNSLVPDDSDLKGANNGELLASDE